MTGHFFQSLQRKIVLILQGLSNIMIGGLFLGLDHQLSRVLEDFKRGHGQTSLARFEQELTNQHEQLRIYGLEYAWWDDVHDMVTQPEDFSSFIEEMALYPEYWSQLDISLMAFFGIDDQYIWGALVSPQQPDEVLSIEAHFPDLLDPANPLLGHNSPEESKTGLMVGPLGIMMVNSYPILRSDQSGPVHGSLVIGRYLTQRLQQQIQAHAGIELLVHEIREVKKSERLNAVTRQLASQDNGQDFVIRVVDGHSEAFKLYRNTWGEPAILFEIVSDPGVESIGGAMIRTTMALIILLIAFIIGVEWLLLHRLIIRPVSRLKAHIAHMKQSGNLASRIELSNRDELGSLADEFNDLTDKLAKSNTELQAARDLALRTADAKSQFLATMSHEIRTPMNGVLGMAELMWGTQLDQNQKNLTRNIITSGQHLLTVINDILDYTKIETGNLTLDEEPFDLSEMVEETAGLRVVQAHAKGLELMLEFRGEPECLLIGDRNRISQVLVNLIGNAIKFTHEGDVRVTVTVGREEQSQQQIKMEVRDTGIGIPEDVQLAIFEEFQQADKGASRKFEGTGLELSICRSLLRLMGSDIQLQSEPGMGSNFWFTLNLPVSSIPVPAVPEYGCLVGKRALVIDDNEMNLSILGKQLEQWGMSCQGLKYGALVMDCLQSAQKDGKDFDLILLDFHMPGVSGLDVVRQVRASMAFRHIPVLMLSSASTGIEKQQAEAARVNGFVTKPVRRWQLLSRLKDLLDTPTSKPGREPARPGTPISKQWPPAKSAVRSSSTTRSCPMMTL